jgi:hypothetical protein
MTSMKIAILAVFAVGASGCAMEQYTPPTQGETAWVVYSGNGTIENGTILSYEDDQSHHARFVGMLGQRQVPNLFGSGNVGVPVYWLQTKVAAPGRVTNLVSLRHAGMGWGTTCSVLFDFNAQPGKSYQVHFSYDKKRCYVQVGRRDEPLGQEVLEPSAHANSSTSCKFDKFIRE